MKTLPEMVGFHVLGVVVLKKKEARTFGV